MSSITGSESVLADADADPLRSRLAAYPRPAAVWVGVAVLLLLVEAGAVAEVTLRLLADLLKAIPGAYDPGAVAGLADAAGNVPTLLSRETIPNQGYWNGSRYVGTFLGLQPAWAWLVRVSLVYAYAFACLIWAYVGFEWYRTYYRVADWTPRDDTVDRLRGHTWGLFGLAVVFMFVTMAVFAPALGPTTVDQNLANPYSHTVQYWTGSEVAEASVGEANLGSQSKGTLQTNVGPWSYDDYGRFHPFGTLPSGKDLFTFIAAGSRISLVIGLLSVGLSAGIATVFALLSAYYKGRVDDGLVLLSDSVMGMPQLLLLIMLSVVLAGTWIGKLYSGAFVLALIFAGTGWPYMWRSLRGPALQVSEQEWVDAARSFGQSPGAIMRKHMLPYITGYLLIYGSMTLGGAIIAIAGLSFLGLGVDPPTPEWGRAVNAGQDYVTTASWHISLIPGLLITLVVTGFNALGDGIRDAIDPESDSAEGEAGGRGGGA
ncbi:ABC transporter permease [Halobaculum sp. EA56]|uniref:ABC transporter permease n=1 Tax=Halobaculum sp. EA56 TaxID=3421648 RepID=UPI003EC104AE